MNVHTKVDLDFLFVIFQHDQIYYAAIQLSWNLLAIKEQHFYRFHIEQCQIPRLISIGGFIPLNFETSVQVDHIFFQSFLVYDVDLD